MRSGFLYAIDLSVKLPWALLGLALIFSCTSNAKRDSLLLAKDNDALRQLNEINAGLSQTKLITPDDFGRLVKLREKYPAAPEVAMSYKAALIAREDWETLEKLIVSNGLKTRDEQLMLAKVRIKLGKYSDGLAILKNLGPADDNDLDFHSLCAIAYSNLGDDPAAAAEIDGILQQVLERKRIDDINLRGTLYFREKNYENAIRTFKRTLEIDPSDPVATNMLGRVYEASGDTKNAEVFRLASENAHEKRNADELKQMQFVSLAARLRSAWDQKRYDEVIRLGEQMLPIADAQNRPAVEQYIADARAAAGKK